MERRLLNSLCAALGRVFDLVGGTGVVRRWYNELPHNVRPARVEAPVAGQITGHFERLNCRVCDKVRRTHRDALCESCSSDAQRTLLVVQRRLVVSEQRVEEFLTRCSQCCGGHWLQGASACTSLDCSVFFARRQALADREDDAKLRADACAQFGLW